MSFQRITSRSSCATEEPTEGLAEDGVALPFDTIDLGKRRLRPPTEQLRHECQGLVGGISEHSGMRDEVVRDDLGAQHDQQFGSVPEVVVHIPEPFCERVEVLEAGTPMVTVSYGGQVVLAGRRPHEHLGKVVRVGDDDGRDLAEEPGVIGSASIPVIHVTAASPQVEHCGGVRDRLVVTS